MTKSDRAQRQLKFTAYHEAGHAVACILFDRKFRHVTIEPGDDSLGHVLHARFSKSFRPDLEMTTRIKAAIEDHILIGMAGMSAERVVAGRRDWRGGRQDISTAIDFASYLYFESEVLGKYLDFMIARADHLMRSAVNWAQVEAVADALLARRTLTWVEARDICREVIRDGRRITVLLDEHTAQDMAEQAAIREKLEVE